MARTPKIKRVLGFDPSINDAAWAMVDDKGRVTCGLIRNQYKKGNKLDHWDKLGTFIETLQPAMHEVFKQLPKLDGIVCEGQYCTRRGNQEHNVRLGWVSAIIYSMAFKRGERLIAVPSKWTRNKPKELRHSDLAECVQDEIDWTWIGPKAPASLIHNVWDAVGMAVWGLSKINRDGRPR